MLIPEKFRLNLMFAKGYKDKMTYADSSTNNTFKDKSIMPMLLNKYKPKKEATRLAKELATIVLKDYSNMKIADGQGWINFEAYKMLKNLEGNWSQKQDDLYKRIVNGDIILASEIKEYFPPYKLQYSGNIKVNGLPLNSFHKFSLAPLIPSVHTMNTRLGQLINRMSEYY